MALSDTLNDFNRLIEMTLPTNEIPPTEKVTFKDFLEKNPPGKMALVDDIGRRHDGRYSISEPEIQLYCGSETCDGIRFFTCVTDTNHLSETNTIKNFFLRYSCKNCSKSSKTFSLRANFSTHPNGTLVKFGEIPAFGPNTPARLVTLLGGAREYFFKGRRSENQGLGIAAFAYYRRVVEDQRNKIFDEVIRVSKILNASEELLSELEVAKKETQFSKAVSEIRHAIPQVLLINGHNPLTLLHSALSEGLHARTDEECLEFATSIRVVLTEFTERLSSALKNDSELNAAVSKLLTAKSKQSE